MVKKLATKTPTHRARVGQTAWVLLSIRAGVAEVRAVCSSLDTAQGVAHAMIGKLCGTVGRPPHWAPTSNGGQLLIYARDQHSFHFRTDPWLMDTEA